MTKKMPWMKWEPGAWRQNAMLRLCSIEARGLWIEMICLMHEGQPYGYLTFQNKSDVKAPLKDTLRGGVYGNPISMEQLALLTTVPIAKVLLCIAELEANGVFNRDENGTIYCRKMVSDLNYSTRQSYYGKLGGRPAVNTPEKANPLPGFERDNSIKGGPKGIPKGSPKDTPKPRSIEVRVKKNNTVNLEKTDKAKATSLVCGGLFGLWVRVHSKDQTRTRLTAQRRAKIKARLEEGYPEIELAQAIKGALLSPFHQGGNLAGKRYNDIGTIFKQGANVERHSEAFLEHKGKGGNFDKFQKHFSDSGNDIEILYSELSRLKIPFKREQSEKEFSPFD